MGVSHNIPADVSAIERELQRQWQEQPFGESIVRTRTLNLVIVSRTDFVPSEVIAELTQAHPCRAIVVDLAADVAGIDAHVASSCVLAHTGASCLAREEVRLRTAAGVKSLRLESMVAALLVPGLPTFLWWRGQPDVDNPVLIQLSAHCDRLVVDSADYGDLSAGFVELHHAISGGRLPAIADFAWSRISAWRELTAQFFDSRLCAEFASHISQVRIANLTGDGMSSDAVLFAAWIARQLDWHAVRPQPPRQWEHRIAFQRAAKTCEIQFSSYPAAGRGLYSVQLIAAKSKEATFSIEQTADRIGLITTTRLGAQQQVQRTVRDRNLSVAEILGREFASASRDVLYEQVLSLAAEMVGAAE